MDISDILKQIGSKQLNDVSKKTGASKNDIMSILGEALPLLAGGTSEKDTEKKVSKKTGFSLATVTSVLGSAGPMLSGLLGGSGNSGSSSQSSSSGGLGSLLGGLLGDGLVRRSGIL